MARFKVVDRVIITEGDFKGERGAIVDKKLLGDGLVVALEKNGKEITNEEGHVSLADCGLETTAGASLLSSFTHNPAFVDQVERASDYGHEGWGFETFRARHK